MIGILDFKMGNIGSVSNMLKKCGALNKLVSTSEDLKDCSKLILPGVGSFNSGMEKVHKSELLPVVEKMVIENAVPVLGICLGMQLLFEGSEEGRLDGLGWLPGTVKKFNFDENNENLKIPHMGWNYISRVKKTKLLGEPVERERYYFVHSFYVENSDEYTVATTNYGQDFTCVVNKNNIYGVQFHPEKSHKYGMCLLKNFSEL